MPDRPPPQPEEQDAHGPDELARLWESGDHASFYAEVERALRPRVVRSLRSQYRLTEEEADDCFSEAIEDLVRRAPEGAVRIIKPGSYLWTSAAHAALRFVRVSRRFVSRDDIERTASDNEAPVEADFALLEPDLSPEGPSAASATLLVEEAVGDAVVPPQFALDLVGAALERLSPTERRVVGFLLSESSDFDFETGDFAVTSGQAEAALGMSRQAYRQAKSRAYRRLREVIPQIIRDLGVTLPARAAQSILGDDWTGPGSEES